MVVAAAGLVVVGMAVVHGYLLLVRERRNGWHQPTLARQLMVAGHVGHVTILRQTRDRLRLRLRLRQCATQRTCELCRGRRRHWRVSSPASKMFHDLNVPWTDATREMQRTVAFLAECECFWRCLRAGGRIGALD